ncbi:MAG: DUF1028 domain-containing protein [Actinomycetota bacterium]
MTYSIVARCPETGDLGVAVQSHWFAAGVVCWARSGVGAVATQAMALVDHGPLGLDELAGGRDAAGALAARLAADEHREVRQVAVLDARGGVATHTGSQTIPEAGHVTGDGFSCQANMMWNATVWDAMADAVARSRGDLAGRLLAALEAGEGEGGDIRGRQAARILVVAATPSERPWDDVRVDLRVDDHAEPLPELRRLLDLHRAYVHLDASEQAQTVGDAPRADREAAEALRLGAGTTEIAFWRAVGLANLGRVDEARALARAAFDDYPGWAELLRRCAERGLAGVTPETVSRLLPG